jgi:hypothetical protein
MRTFISATEDASIYQRYPSSNTGLDEILEIGKLKKSTDMDVMYASSSVRSLLNFDIPSNQQYPTNSVYLLNLRIATAKHVNRYQTIEVYPVSRSWVEGSGYFYQDVRNVNDGIAWNTAAKHVSWSNAGGDIALTPSASYTLSKMPLEDIKINVTNLISPVVSGSTQIPWNGLLLKFPDADEGDSTNVGNIKVFSSNTHTVFAPKLEILWKNQTFITGSLKPLPSSTVSIIPKNIKESYTLGEIDKVYLVVRELYPDKRFDAVQRYRTTYYLPSSSYFRIKDVISNVVLFDFDDYSLINCDLSGSYISLDTTGLDVDRYYSIDLKVKRGDQTSFPEFNYMFKVDRNG